MDASSLLIMTLRDWVITGGSHAPTSLYAYTQRCLATRLGGPAGAPETPRSRAQVPRRSAPDAPVLRRRADHLDLRRLQTPARRPLPRGRTARPAGHPARPRRDPTATQPRLGRGPAQRPPPAPPT